MYEIYRHKPEDELPIIIIIVYVQHEDSHFISRVLFRTHLAKIKCFNLRAEDGLEVNVVLEAQPSALRNREAIRVHQH